MSVGEKMALLRELSFFMLQEIMEEDNGAKI